MNLNALLAELSDRGVKLLVDGEQLRIQAPKGVITPDLRNALANNKVELIRLLHQNKIGAASIPLVPVSQTQNVPVSFQQERLWILAQLAAVESAHNIAQALRLNGDLDLNCLEKSINEIFRRHDVFRTTFGVWEGNPVQNIAAPEPFKLSVLNLEHLDTTEQLKTFWQLADEAAEAPFDLAIAPLWRIKLIRLNAREHILLLVIHHIVSDMISMGLWIRELATVYSHFYKGQPSPLLEPAIQYRDFAVWQRQWLNNDALKSELAYWKQQLQGASFELKLPIDHPRPPLQNFQGRRKFFKLDPVLWAAIKQRSHEQMGITSFMTFVAAFKALIYLCSQQEDILIGFTASGRVHPQVESLIGFFGYPLLLRTDLSGNPTFAEVLSRVRSVLLSAYAHQNVPFGKVVEVMGSSRVAQDTPFFQTFRTGLSYVNSQLPSDLTNLPNLTFSLIDEGIWGPTDLDLYTYIYEVGADLQIGIAYNTDIFESETIDAFGNTLFQILEQWVKSKDIRLNEFILPTDLDRKAKLARSRYQKPKLAIAATFTADSVADSLNFWMQQLNLPSEITFAPYNQVFQQLLNPDSLLSQNETGVNIVLVRLEDWVRSEDLQELSSNEQKNSIERNAQDLVIALRQSCERTQIPHLLCLLPSNSIITDTKIATFLQQMEANLLTELADISGLHIINYQELAISYPVTNFYDAYSDEIGHIPFTPAFFTALGTMLARKIHCLHRPPYKVIVLDCDQTLWQGVCGEDGVEGIVIDSSYQALQEFMIQQCDRGMLLCLCSKNNQADVFAVLEQRSDMRLKRHHLAAWQINWQTKSENLKLLSQELGLSLDNFIFIDDNPIECAEVRYHCPEILTLQLPTNATEIPQFLAHIWAFDRLNITVEDRQRTIVYQQNRQRQQAANESLTLRDFLNSLNLQVDIMEMQPSQVDRVAQLTQRTNQFNTTTLRRTSAEIKAFCLLDTHTCYVVDVKDRFGNYGLVGMMMVQTTASALVVDTLLLSCRVLGRGVEYQMLNFLGKIALARGLKQIDIIYKPSSKNQPIGDFLEQLVAIDKERLAESYCYKLSADVCRAIAIASERLDKEAKHSLSEGNLTQSDRAIPQQSTNYTALFQKIASDWHTPEQILQQIEESQVQYQQQHQTFVAPRTETEKHLADLWQNLLHRSPLSIYDNFFDLGGNSLLAVQLLSRLRETFHVTIPIHQLLEVPTIAGVAQVIEAIAQTGMAANLAIDLAAEAVLDPAIRPTTAFNFIAQPQAIFLTGATGFLGAYLVDELLQQITANVYCLVRAQNLEQGNQRIQSHLQAYGLWQEQFRSRIIPVIGDLALPNLGLNESQFHQLSHQIDVIYHNGAVVNFLYPYAKLKAANVLGTQAILRLAAQTKVKPVHFVSTLGIFSAPAYANANSIQESDGLAEFEGLQGGYLQSKWVAEKLIMQARDRGLPVCIYRPGAISGHSQTGIANVDDFFCSLTKGCIQLGMVPDLEFPLDLTPVDYGSRAIVHLSQNPDLFGKAFHLVSPQSLSWRNWCDLVRSLGYSLEQVSYHEWYAKLLHNAEHNIPNALHAFLPLLDEQLLKNVQLPAFDCQNTLTGLADTNIIYPTINTKLLNIYFAYFKKSGFLIGV
ncbi:MAG: thioester reductase domain-containing protein [Nostoc sp.]